MLIGLTIKLLKIGRFGQEMDVFAVGFGVAGGLAIFLFALHMLSESLKKVVGEKLKQLLAKMTNNPVKGSLLGALTAASLQSSGLTMVILIGLINAGVLTLSQGIGVMLGSEIGTTITAQIVASNVGAIFYPIIAIGFLLSIIPKNKKYRNIGQVILSVGLVYLGMNIMSTSIRPLQDEPGLKNFLFDLGRIPITGLIGGIVITAIFNSSTALMGLVLSLGMNNLISLDAAIAIMLGANIGSCVTGGMASFGSSISSKRLSLVQLLINIIGVLLFFPFISNFTGLITMTSSELPRQIANAHTIFNITVTLIMLPLVGVMVRLSTRLLPGQEIVIKRGTEFIDPKLLTAPSIALSQAEKEVHRLGKLTYEMLEHVILAIQNDRKESIAKVKELEGIVDEIYHNLEKYLDDSRFTTLSDNELKKLAYLKHSTTDIERVGDHANYLAEQAEKMMKKNLHFSEDAKKEITIMADKTKAIYRKSIDTLEAENEEALKEVQALKEQIDHLHRDFVTNHVWRLEYKKCDPVCGIMYVDILRNLERVANHSTNIANSTMQGF